MNVEHIIAKGEIARFEQFLLLSKCFQYASAAEATESVYMWEKINEATHNPTVGGFLSNYYHDKIAYSLYRVSPCNTSPEASSVSVGVDDHKVRY